MSDYFDPAILALTPAELRRDMVQATVRARREGPSAGRLFLPTVPVLLAGSVALAMTMPVIADEAAERGSGGDRQPEADRRQDVPRASGLAGPTISTAVAASPTLAASSVASLTPSTHTVKKGDTVSSIAASYGLSTAKVLAWNGLGWSSLIFPGQKLSLTAPGSSGSSSSGSSSAGSSSSSGSSAPAATKHTVKKGDTVSAIAAKYGTSTAKVLAANGLSWTSLIFPGQKLTIPGASTSNGNGSSSSGSGSSGSGSSSSPGSGAADGDSSASDPADTDPADTEESASEVDPIAAVCTSVTYTIGTGDTVSKIAAKFGVSTASVLKTNGLTSSSLIFAGQTLTIEKPTKLTDNCVVYASLTGEMKRNAQIIVDVGRDAGVSDYGLVIALATAAQESGLRNLNYGDADSLGVFQQRPSAGWGTASQVRDVERAAAAFFGGSINPNSGTRGLLDIRGWESMTVTQAAQAVQISATPNAYAKWEASARYWLSQLD